MHSQCVIYLLVTELLVKLDTIKERIMEEKDHLLPYLPIITDLNKDRDQAHALVAVCLEPPDPLVLPEDLEPPELPEPLEAQEILVI